MQRGKASNKQNLEVGAVGQVYMLLLTSFYPYVCEARETNQFPDGPQGYQMKLKGVMQILCKY